MKMEGKRQCGRPSLRCITQINILTTLRWPSQFLTKLQAMTQIYYISLQYSHESNYFNNLNHNIAELWLCLFGVTFIYIIRTVFIRSFILYTILNNRFKCQELVNDGYLENLWLQIQTKGIYSMKISILEMEWHSCFVKIGYISVINITFQPW